MAQTHLRFDIPEYEQAIAHLMDAVAKGLIAQDGLLALVPVRRTVHSGPSRNVRTPEPLDQPLSTLEHRIAIPFDVIRNTDIAAFLQILCEFAQAYQRQMGTTLFQTIDAVTSAVGNNVDAQGQALTFDLFTDMLERLELSADEQGRLRPPTIYAHPKLAQKLATLQPTHEQAKRFEAIMQRKQAEYDAQKRTRRLPR